jgi:ATP-dependent Clp protease protease subunit
MRPTQLLNLLARNAKRGEFRAEGNVIFLYDVIVGHSRRSGWAASARGLHRQLKAMTGPVDDAHQLPGRQVFAARAMAQAMRGTRTRDHRAHVDGVAASAAS